MNPVALPGAATASCSAGRQITLPSRHAEERVMAPIFAEPLGAELCVDFGYDTDQLGTVTRHIPRLLGQGAAAARKARLATDRTGLPLGLGSEGAFGNPDRMARMASATEDLARRLLSCRPECGTPGFGEVNRRSGLPCAACAAPARETPKTTHECLNCAHRVRLPVARGTWADPAYCDAGNP
jgi:hypothetical protein